MFVCTIKFDKKKALFVIAMAALIIFGIIMLLGIDRGGDSTPTQSKKANSDDRRVEYLSSLGWQVETPAISVENVLIPKSFSDVFNKYNELQQSQGFDLSRYAGKEVELYTYKVTNHESDDMVLAEIYVYKGEVIGGDIHSSALDGFMTGLKKQ